MRGQKLLFLLTPACLMVVYLCLYVYASFLYPGGSQQEPQSVGFSWLYNYWCDLLNARTWYGIPNPAEKVALAAQMVLCFSMALFWVIFPICFLNPKMARIATICGVISMLFLVFLSSRYHDRVIDLSGLSGGVAVLVTLHQLYQMGRLRLMLMGGICCLLAGLNYLIYLTRIGIPVLPALQKITFVATLIWFGILNGVAYKIIKRK